MSNRPGEGHTWIIFSILNFKICLAEDAVLDYNRDDASNITFLHTNVPAVCQGKGLANKLAEVQIFSNYYLRVSVETR